MSDAAQPTPPANATVRFLATVEPTATDRQRYEAGSEWTLPLDRAEAFEAEGTVELLDLLEPPAPATPDLDED